MTGSENSLKEVGKMIRCTSPICITNKDQIKGREFEPPEKAEGLAKIWCPQCIQLSTQIQFFAGQTANMVRGIYQSYINTELPKEVKLILKQFALEILQQLGEEL
jgi:hypothetical protein